VQPMAGVRPRASKEAVNQAEFSQHGELL